MTTATLATTVEDSSGNPISSGVTVTYYCTASSANNCPSTLPYGSPLVVTTDSGGAGIYVAPGVFSTTPTTYTTFAAVVTQDGTSPTPSACMSPSCTLLSACTSASCVGNDGVNHMAFIPTAAANLTVTGPSSHPADGTPVTLTARVTAQTGYPLSNQTVWFSLSGVGQISSTYSSPTPHCTTNNGTCSVYVSSAYNLGLATITATTTATTGTIVSGSGSVNFIASQAFSAGLSYVTVAPVAGTGVPTQVADGVSQMVVTAYAIDTTNQPMPAGTLVQFFCQGCSTSAVMTPASGAGSTTLSGGASTFTATVVDNYISTNPDPVKYEAHISASGTATGSGYTPYTSANWIAAIPAPLNPPTNLTATGTCGGPVSLSWLGPGATTYHVYVSSTSASGPWTNSSNPHTPYWSDTTLAANTNYYFYVVASNSMYTSAASAVAPFYCVPPAAPTPVTVSGGCATGTSVTVNWGASPTATTYQVARSPASGTQQFTPLGTVSAPATSYIDATASTNTPYIYQVTALNSAGSSTATSANLTCPSTGVWLVLDLEGPLNAFEGMVISLTDPTSGAPLEPNYTIAAPYRFPNRLPNGTAYKVSIVSGCPSDLTCFVEDQFTVSHAQSGNGKIESPPGGIVWQVSLYAGPSAWQKVVSGGETGLGLAASPAGTIWTWGTVQQYDNEGLGPTSWDIGPSSVGSPVQIGTDNDWVQVAANYDLFAGIKSDGTLWQWGNDNWFVVSYFGGGNGVTNTHTTPTQYGSGTDWKQIAISGGGNQGLALKTDGSLWTWGYDNADLSGHTFYYSATQVGTDTDWASVAASDQDAVLLKTDGSAWAWGYDFHGALPQQIGAGPYVTAAVGDENIFLIDSAGALWGLGSNTYGELGNNSYANNGCDCFSDEPTLTPLSATSPAGSPWVAVGSGTYEGGTTGAVDQSGNLYVWGDNSLGQFGILSYNDGNHPQSDVPLLVGGGYSGFVGGYQGFSFGIKTDRSLWSWGNFANWAIGYSSNFGDPNITDPNPFQPPALVP